MVLDSLGGDGISEALFHYLWEKDELGYGPSINIPDTIVYKFGQATAWYFTGLDGKIKKKNKHNVVNVKIEETFCKKATSDIVGYYIYEVIKEKDKIETSIEYLDAGGLRDFLYGRWKENNGILQRFIEPKGMYNGIVRAIWSPKVCLIERKVNCKQLHDRRFGLYERAVTYEGPEHFSQAAPLRGSTLPNEIQTICEETQSHISEASFRKYQILRMVLHLKIDAKDKVWLLWSTSIRVADTDHHASSPYLSNEDDNCSLVNIDSILRLPAHIRLDSRPSHAIDLNASDNKIPITNTVRMCTSCGRNIASTHFHRVQYKFIISHFDQLLTLLRIETDANGTFAWPPSDDIIDAAGGVGFGLVQLEQLKKKKNSKNKHKINTIKEIELHIPPIIREAHPRLTLEAYLKYKHDPLFLYKTIELCEDCFLAYAELATAPLRPITESPAPSEDRKPLPKPAKPKTKRGVPPTHYEKKSSLDTSSSAFMPPTEAPSLPPTVFTRSTEINQEPFMNSTLNKSLFSINEHNNSIISPQDPEPIEDLVRKREEAFFREFHDNNNSTQIPKGHPLTHMVTTHQVLSVAQPYKTHVPKSKYKPKRSPYLDKPTLIDARDNSTANAIIKEKQSGRDQSITSTTSINTSMQLAPSASSIKHRQFLIKTLEDVQRHLTTPNALRVWKDDSEAAAAIGSAPALLSSNSLGQRKTAARSRS